MVQSLPGFLDLCLNVCSPSQVLRDVYTEVLEAANPLHRGPTDHKRSVGSLLSLPEVYNLIEIRDNGLCLWCCLRCMCGWSKRTVKWKVVA